MGPPPSGSFPWWRGHDAAAFASSPAGGVSSESSLASSDSTGATRSTSCFGFGALEPLPLLERCRAFSARVEVRRQIRSPRLMNCALVRGAAAGDRLPRLSVILGGLLATAPPLQPPHPFPPPPSPPPSAVPPPPRVLSSPPPASALPPPAFPAAGFAAADLPRRRPLRSPAGSGRRRLLPCPRPGAAPSVLGSPPGCPLSLPAVLSPLPPPQPETTHRGGQQAAQDDAQPHTAPPAFQPISLTNRESCRRIAASQGPGDD